MRLSVRHVLPVLAMVAACAEDPSTPPPSTLGATAADVVDDGPFVAGELIVKLDPAAGPVTAGVALDVAGVRVVPVTALPSGSWLVRLAPAQRRVATADLAAATLDAVDVIRAAPDVAYAYPNARLEFSLTPNDPYYARQQWHYDAIHLPAAWDHTTGSSAVRVAIIDTGRRNHPELSGRWAPGYDFVDGDADPTDPGTWAHGIHVAGIIGAASNNGAGTAGICWSCQLIPLRVTPTLAQAEQAVAYAAGLDVAARRAEVINMSFNWSAATSCNTYPGLRDTITAAINRGVVVVASAGNQGQSSGPHVPANCPGVIAVAASQPDGALAPYSNYGAGVTVVAPGGGLFNNSFYGAGVGCPADPNPNDPYAGTVGAFSTWSIGTSHCYRYLSGTSMAAPHVTGVVALMLAANPSLTPAQVAATLQATAHPITCPVAGGCGAGLIDAAAAVAGLQPEIVVTPRTLAFPPTRIGTSAALVVTVANTGTGPLTFAATSTAADFTVSCGGGPCPGVVLAGTALGVRVTFTPHVVGTQAATLVVTSNDADEPITNVALTGVGTAPAIAVTPAALAFGTAPVNTQTQRTLTISNPGTAPLIITAAPAPTAYAVNLAQPTTIQPGGSLAVTVTCLRQTVGNLDGTLTLINNSGTTPLVPLTCTAATPGHLVVVVPSSGELRFRPSEVGTIIALNDGQSPVTITSLDFSGGADTWFKAIHDLPAVVPPGQTIEWTVTCAPRTRAGVHWEKHAAGYNGFDSESLLAVGCDTGPYIGPLDQ